VWVLWTNPANWPGTSSAWRRSAEISPVGARITLKAKGLPTIRLTVTRIDPESLWVGVSKLRGLTVEFEHIIECADSARLLVERGILTGPFAVVAARLIGNRLAATFAALTAQVTRRVEAQA
jgi:hypothetical protein